jgi:hypothetical protein
LRENSWRKESLIHSFFSFGPPFEITTTGILYTSRFNDPSFPGSS